MAGYIIAEQKRKYAVISMIDYLWRMPKMQVYANAENDKKKMLMIDLFLKRKTTGG